MPPLPQPSDVDSAVARGKQGEVLAEAYLCAAGYRIVERNFFSPWGEIDRIAFEGDVLCFVEVRARASACHGDPLESISPSKIKRIGQTARFYLTRLPGPWPLMRFDALGILLQPSPKYTLLRNAFETSG
jgi:putative endonuclease